MSRTPDKFINPNFTNNTSDGTKDSSASYSREALEEILKTYQLDVASNLSNGLVLDIERDTARKTAIQAISDLCTKRETLAQIQKQVTLGKIEEVSKLRQEQMDFVKAQSGHIRNNNNWPRTRGAGKTALDAVAWLDRRLAALQAELESKT